MNGVVESVRSQLGNLNVSESWVKAGIIIALIFILLLVMAKMSRGYISWYSNGWWLWAGMGFLIAIILEGFFVIGGSTISTNFLAWQNAPKPIRTILESSRARLTKVLGENSEAPTKESVVEDFELLSEDDIEKVRADICKVSEENE